MLISLSPIEISMEKDYSFLNFKNSLNDSVFFLEVSVKLENIMWKVSFLQHDNVCVYDTI